MHSRERKIEKEGREYKRWRKRKAITCYCI